jgi:hypothetical protein
MPSTLYQGGQNVLDLRTQGRQIDMLLTGGQVVFVRDSLATDGRVPWGLAYRIVEDDEGNGPEKWFEVGIPVEASETLTGNPAAGWTYLHEFFGMELQWSEDLINWSYGKFGPVVGSPESATINGDEVLIYWGRSLHPQDSSISTGQIVAELTARDDVRMSPITAIIINDTAQALPNFPYTMPGDAAQLQADLRGLGWTGATMEASAATVWRLVLPEVPFDAYSFTNLVFWPGFLVPDYKGDLVNVCDRHYFEGSFINAANVRTKLSKQFARVKFTILKL